MMVEAPHQRTSASAGAHTYREILSQGQVWRATLASARSQTEDWLAWLREPRGETVFTGCGSTYYLSLSAAAHWRAITGSPARGVPASDLWLSPRTSMPLQPALLVTVSRSAQTTETLRALETYQAHSPNAVSLAISAYAGRELTARTTHSLIARGAEEESVAQTRSFSSMLVLAQAAAGLAAGDDAYLGELERVPDAFAALVERYERLARQIGRNRSLERFTFLGSGAYYGLAAEAMLKMKEMSLSPSEAFHVMEFRHGPKSVIAQDACVVGLISDEAASEELKVLAEMRELGATTIAIMESAAGLPARVADEVVELKSDVGSLARGALLLPFLQLVAYYRSTARGLNPDRPTNLEAVVVLG